MTIRVGKHTVLREAQRMASELKRLWPDIEMRASLEPQEDGDAVIWVTVSPALESEVRTDAAGLTVDLYEDKGIYIKSRMIPRHDTDGADPKDADVAK